MVVYTVWDRAARVRFPAPRQNTKQRQTCLTLFCIVYLPDMELWFWVAVGGAVVSGISNFFFKVAAKNECNAELYILYSSLTSMVITTTLLVVWPQQLFGFGWIAFVVFVAGMTSALAGSLKVYALRYIDSTLYFPLFKLIVPALAICIGVTFFEESFSAIEWTGLIVGLLVPLMLINRSENSRQENLRMGLLLILITGILSTITAVAAKYAIVAEVPVNTTLLLTVLGISLGAVFLIVRKNGVRKIPVLIKEETTSLLVKIAVLRSTFIVTGVWAMLYAYSLGGTLSVVQTIHSMYILIPIVLAIIFYNEHWNLQKAAAIALSVVSLAFLG